MHALCQQFLIMALFEQIEIPYRTDSTGYLSALRSLGGSVWLDSGKPGGTFGRWDIISAAPLFTLRLEPTLQCHGAAPGAVRDAATLEEAVAATLQWLNECHHTMAPTVLVEDTPFQAGLIGCWAYDLGLSLHRIVPALADRMQLPQVTLGCYTWALLQDHETQQALLSFHPSTPASLSGKAMLSLTLMCG